LSSTRLRVEWCRGRCRLCEGHPSFELDVLVYGLVILLSFLCWCHTSILHALRDPRASAGGLVHVFCCPPFEYQGSFGSKWHPSCPRTLITAHDGENDCEGEFKAYLNYSKTKRHDGATKEDPYISNLCNVRTQHNCPIIPTDRKRGYPFQRRAPPRLAGSFLMARVPGDCTVGDAPILNNEPPAGCGDPGTGKEDTGVDGCAWVGG